MKLSSFVIAFTILNSVFAARTLRSRSFKHVVHEKRGAPNGAWIKRSLADRESLMPMRIGLTQRNLDDGHDLLMEISDPVSPKYGKHLSHAQVIDMFAPSDESREVVLHWLHSFGINRDRVSVSRNKQWIQFDARVVEAEALLDTTYHIYEHGPSGRVNVACEQYHVPEYIKHHIDYITPGVKLFHLSGPLSPERDKAKKREPQPQPKAALKPTPKGAPGGLGFVLQPIFRTISSFLSGLLTIGFLAGILPCSTTNPMLMTPYCIRQLYSITTLPSNTVINEDNKLGIFQSLGQLYSETDIDLFNTLLTNIPIGEGTPELRSIDGGQGPSSLIQLQMAGAESNLDIQSSHHIIYPQLEAVFSVDDPPTQANYIYPGFLNNFFDGIDGSYCSFEAFGLNGNSNGTDNPLDPPYPNPDSAGKPGAYPGPLDCGTVKPTYVTSISYGGVENILSLPANYQRRQCLEVMKLGLQGYTFVVASGDSGVATGGEDDDDPDGCLRPAGQTTGPGTIFNPDFPSNCPYFLAVGSTQWDSRRTEIATTALGSGGGFSNVHARPSYQSAAVSQYLASANLGFPSYDISAGDTLGANGGVFNRGGRGYPDVAAIGSNLLVIRALQVNAIPMLVGGTSASAPIWAAMLTRVNEERLKRNMPPVGFVHKLLYDNADKFK
ncbi:Tripeptidyl-peptidase [Drechslerella dactyloides]|uniref:Tripeptidyl-peptidase n=1 Tax=Drechslerella dactyloides TaxID=74499 RepID=A0AAD6IZH1_DREDA|nr:Tripeptidyl-peptidase [Drechslerella dactyloides]